MCQEHGVGFFDGRCGGRARRLCDARSLNLPAFCSHHYVFFVFFFLSRVFNWPARSKCWWPWFVLGFLWQLCVRWANVALYFFVCRDAKNMGREGVGAVLLLWWTKLGRKQTDFVYRSRYWGKKARPATVFSLLTKHLYSILFRSKRWIWIWCLGKSSRPRWWRWRWLQRCVWIWIFGWASLTVLQHSSVSLSGVRTKKILGKKQLRWSAWVGGGLCQRGILFVFI